MLRRVTCLLIINVKMAIRTKILSRVFLRIYCYNSRLGFSPLLPTKRCLSSESIGDIIVDRAVENQDVAWVRLNNKPVNVLSTKLLLALEQVLHHMEDDDSCRGVILSSSIPDVFSAGLDITELYQKPVDDMLKMWRALQDLWLRLYCSPLAIIAAINGNAPAGGCMLAVACDYRIMAQGSYHIGLSAQRVGLLIPFWIQDGMKKTLGHRLAEEAIQKAVLYNVDEAFNIGLIDRVVPSKELEETAMEEMSKLLNIPDHARVLSKQLMRKSSVQRLRDNQEKDIEYYNKAMTQKETQDNIGKYLNNLKNRRM